MLCFSLDPGQVLLLVGPAPQLIMLRGGLVFSSHLGVEWLSEHGLVIPSGATKRPTHREGRLSVTEGSWHEEVSHCIASLAAGQLGEPAVYAATHETKSGPVRRTENGTLAGLAYSALKRISASGDTDSLPGSYNKYLRLVRLGRENEFHSTFGMSPFNARKTVALSWGVPTGEVKMSLAALPSARENISYSTVLSAVEYTTGSFSREARKFLDKSYLRSGLAPGDDTDFASAAKAAGLACSLLMGSGHGEPVLADIATAS